MITDNVDVVTFGCRLNAYESEVIRARAAEDGLSDAIIFNTCAVTGEAVRQARQAIRKARRERPGAKLIVTGCAAQIDPAAFAAMGEVDLVLGNAEKSAPGAYLPQAEPMRVRVNDIMSVRETAGHLIDGLKDRARAYVEVQNGTGEETARPVPGLRGITNLAAYLNGQYPVTSWLSLAGGLRYDNNTAVGEIGRASWRDRV